MKNKKILLIRKKLDKLDKGPEITNRHSEHFNKPIDYAMKIYSIFICFNCKKPYFGGDNKCADPIDDGSIIDPKERLCSQCSNPQSFATECKKHGNEYIQWKCRYCCNFATFFCFGTTHFCEQCHSNAYGIKNIAADERAQCPSRFDKTTRLPKKINGVCPLGQKHPLHGEEYCLGCAYCRKKIN